MEQQIIIVSGVSGSGKSTFSKSLGIKNSVIISRDPLRSSLYGYDDSDIEKYYKSRELTSNESFITKIHDAQSKVAIEQGKTVIVDNTNLRLADITKYQKYQLPITVIFMNTDLKTCIQRDGQRERTVGKEIIDKQYKKFAHLPNNLRKEGFTSNPRGFYWRPEQVKIYKNPSKIKTDQRLIQKMYNEGKEDLPKCIICDLDGTLSMMNGRTPYDGKDCITDALNSSVESVLRVYNDLGYKIFLFSGRNSDNGGEEATIEWLDFYEIPYEKLVMRGAGDMRKDTVVKKEMFDENIRDRYQVEFWMDDRNMVVDLVRDMGIDCFQVYYGNF